MTIETACGSVIGAAHLRAARNGQDGWAIERNGESVVLVVADGCGSARHSEVGAKLGAAIVARAVAARAETTIDWDEVAAAAVEELARLARHVDVEEHLLFTIVGALLTPTETTIFHAGDGFYAINGETRALGPYPENAPPYLAYALGGTARPSFEIAEHRETSHVESVLLATDGAEPLVARGTFAELAHVGRNPDALRRRLFLLTRPGNAALEDDTTVALARQVN
jgi:serine/threonine protein phosphatase PrpC